MDYMDKLFLWGCATLITLTLALSHHYKAVDEAYKEGYNEAHVESMGDTIGPRVAACKAIKGVPSIQGGNVLCLLDKF